MAYRDPTNTEWNAQLTGLPRGLPPMAPPAAPVRLRRPGMTGLAFSGTQPQGMSIRDYPEPAQVDQPNYPVRGGTEPMPRVVAQEFDRVQYPSGPPAPQKLGMASGLGGELHAAQMAALGRGESIDTGAAPTPMPWAVQREFNQGMRAPPVTAAPAGLTAVNQPVPTGGVPPPREMTNTEWNANVATPAATGRGMPWAVAREFNQGMRAPPVTAGPAGLTAVDQPVPTGGPVRPAGDPVRDAVSGVVQGLPGAGLARSVAREFDQVRFPPPAPGEAPSATAAERIQTGADRPNYPAGQRGLMSPSDDPTTQYFNKTMGESQAAMDAGNTARGLGIGARAYVGAPLVGAAEKIGGAVGSMWDAASGFGRGLLGMDPASNPAVTQNAVNAATPKSGGPSAPPDESGYTQGNVSAKATDVPVPRKINYATEGTGFQMRDAMRGTVKPGTQMESNYGYGDTITATADKSGRLNQFSGFNPLPGGQPGGAGPVAAAAGGIGGPTAQRMGMAPGVSADLYAAQKAAVGRGESIDFSGERMPEPQQQIDTSHRFDQDIQRMGSSGDVFDQWRSRRMAKIRDAEVGRKLEGIQAQTGQQNAMTAQQTARAAQQTANQAIPLEQMRLAGQARGQDLTAAAARESAATNRYSSELGLVPYLPKLELENRRNQYLEQNKLPQAQAVANLLHPSAGGAGNKYQMVKGDISSPIAYSIHDRSTGEVKHVTHDEEAALAEQRRNAAKGRELFRPQ